MKTAKIYVSSAIFIVLTLIKITVPSAHAIVSEAIESALEAEAEQTDFVLSEAENWIKSENETVLPQSGVLGIDNGKRMAKSYADIARNRFEEAQNEGQLMYEKNKTVSAFIQTQSEFAECEIPEKVLLDIPNLGFEYVCPVDGVTSSGFGYRMHPIENTVKFHYGTDFAVNTGTEVKAFADGTVVAAGNSESYGKYVEIDHGNGYRTLYAHCSELLIVGGEVKRGEVIALSGESGLATGPHLHFELTCGEKYLNPEFYL